MITGPRSIELEETVHPRPVVILVDDDPAVLAALTFAFETGGYAVEAFADAESLLAAPASTCACLIVDQHLPGIEGVVLLELMRARGESAPLVLITTSPTAVTRRRASALGAEIVEKPLLGDALRLKVGQLTAGGR